MFGYTHGKSPKIKSITSSFQRCRFEPVVISCAGSYGDDEAILKWRKEQEEVGAVGELFGGI